jgi:acetolactate synthase-1/2/3 large subunit
MDKTGARTGGRLLVDQLRRQNVGHVTCVPGESYLAVLDALYDSGIDVLVARNEGGACMMAEAYGKLTGRPGICFVTRGPGATNASPGVHIAAQDSTPMILFVGQVDRGAREREAFQEMDYKAFYGSVAKWVVEIEDAGRIPELVARAFRITMQGRPGPVVIALPEDMLTDEVTVVDAPKIEPVEIAPMDDSVEAVATALADASRPFMILGGSRWTEDARAGIIALAERFSLPVGTLFRRASLFPADHANYAGDVGIGQNPALTKRIKDSDLVMLVGGRLSEVSANSYTLLDVPLPRQKLIHVHPSADEIGRIYQPTLGIQASPTGFVTAMHRAKTPKLSASRPSVAEAHADYLAWSERSADLPGRFQYGHIMCWLRDRLGPDAIITNGAGNYSSWIHRLYRFRQAGTQLAPTSGSMGYGVPAAVMAKHLRPDRTVVAFAGDGCFMMNGQEFATAAQFGIPIIVVIVDNGMFGTIRMHQEREYPGRVSATALNNPDFVTYAAAFGGHGERIETTEEFAPAFERAIASGKPAILHCLLDPEAITPATTLSAIREGGLKKCAAVATEA